MIHYILLYDHMLKTVLGYLTRLSLKLSSLSLSTPVSAESITKKIQPVRQNSAKKTAEDYFRSNLEAACETEKAYHAWWDLYHTLAPNEHLRQRRHAFRQESKDGYVENIECYDCGRTRYEVRYDNKPAYCEARPDVEAISNAVLKDEESFFKLIKKAPAIVSKHIKDPQNITGEDLVYLQATHGIYLEIVESVFNIKFSQQVHDEYEKSMQEHRLASENNTHKMRTKRKKL